MRRAALQAGSRCRKYAACGKIVKGTNFWFGLKAIARNVFGKELGYCGVTQRVYPVTDCERDVGARGAHQVHECTNGFAKWRIGRGRVGVELEHFRVDVD